MKDINVLKSVGIDIDSALNSLGDMNMYNDLLETFYTSSLDRLPKIIKYKGIADYQNYAILVHAMKSECLYLGINKLADMCYNHQTKAQSNDLEYITLDFDNLMKEITRVIEAIKLYLGK